MQVRKQQLELDMEQWTGSKLEKEAIKAVLEKAMAPHSRTLAWKILQEMGIPDHLNCLCMQVRKQQLELDMEQQTGSK